MGKNNQTDKTKVSLKINTDKQEINTFTNTLNSFGDIFYVTIKEFENNSCLWQ